LIASCGTGRRRFTRPGINQNRMFVGRIRRRRPRLGVCIRRSTLDRHLQDAARAAGAEVFDNAPVNAMIGTGADSDPFADYCGHSMARTLQSKPRSWSALMASVRRSRGWSARSASGDADANMLYYAYWVDATPATRRISSSSRHGFAPTFPQTMASCLDHERAGRIAPRHKDLEAFYLERISSIPQLWGRLSKGARSPRYAERRGVRDFTAAKPGRAGCC